MAIKYKISIKRDWGPYGYWNSKTRRNEKTGFVVGNPGGNCMPGAVWFETIEDAMIGIEAHVKTGDCLAWYDEYKRIKQSRAKEPETEIC